MARVTIDEIKKIMETEKDMTTVLDANNRMMKKNCEALERHNAMMEKQMGVMEKNTEVMQKYIELIEKQLGEGKKRSERIRSQSEASDTSCIMEIVPPPPPPEPSNKRGKPQESASQRDIWVPPPPANNMSMWQQQNGMNQPINYVPPFINMPMPPTHNFQQNLSQMECQQRVPNLYQAFENTRKNADKASDNKSNIKSLCIFCSNNDYQHVSENCPFLKDHAARINFMKMNYLCLTCSEPRYRCSDARKCRLASRKCEHCRDGTHWKALCPIKYPNVTTSHFRF